MISYTILTHTNYLDNKYVKGPADKLSDFLIKKNRNVTLISLSFEEFGINTYFLNGVASISKTKVRGIFKYIYDLYYIQKKITDTNIYIAVDPISFISLYLFRKNIIFYIVDYSEKRSNNIIYNFLYQIAVNFSVFKCKFVLSSAQNIFEKKNVPENKRIHFPNYPLTDRLEINNRNFTQINACLPFTDINKVDFKYIIEEINKIKYHRFLHNFKLDFIGIKSREDILESYIISNKLQNIINYHFIYDKNTYLKKMETYNLGLDLNTDLFSYTKYRDPIKIREYIFFKIPIITNKNNSIHEEIYKNEIGIIIDDSNLLSNVLSDILNRKINLFNISNYIERYYRFDIDLILSRIERFDD